MAEQGDAGPAGQRAHQRVQPYGAVGGAGRRGRLHAETAGGGVVGPGDHGRAGAGARRALGRVQRRGHAGGRRVPLAVGALEGEQFGVHAGHDDGHAVGAVQVPEDLGDLARARRVEGEDVPVGPEQRLVAAHPPGRLALSGGGEALVVHAGALHRPRLPQRRVVGDVAQGDGGAVHVADGQGIAVGQARALPRRERGEEAGQPGGRGVCVGQPSSVDPALFPGLDRRFEGGGPPLVAQGGPAGGRQHHEHHGQGEQEAPDVQLRGGVEGSHWEDTLGERAGLA